MKTMRTVSIMTLDQVLSRLFTGDLTLQDLAGPNVILVGNRDYMFPRNTNRVPSEVTQLNMRLPILEKQGLVRRTNCEARALTVYYQLANFMMRKDQA